MKLQFVYTNVPLYIAHIWRNFMTWQVVFCHGGNIPITWYHLIRWVNGNNFALQPVYAILQKFAHAQWQQRGPVDLDNNLSTIITTTNNRPRPRRPWCWWHYWFSWCWFCLFCWCCRVLLIHCLLLKELTYLRIYIKSQEKRRYCWWIWC